MSYNITTENNIKENKLKIEANSLNTLNNLFA